MSIFKKQDPYLKEICKLETPGNSQPIKNLIIKKGICVLNKSKAVRQICIGWDF